MGYIYVMAHTVGVTLVGTVGVTLGHTLWYVGVTIRLYFITLGYTVGNTLVCGCGCGCVHVGVGVTLGGDNKYFIANSW